MTEHEAQNAQGNTHNYQQGTVHGDVVQAGSVHGGVHTYHTTPVQQVHYHAPPRRARMPLWYYSIPLALLARLGWRGTGRMALGAYAGTCCAGLLAVVSGRTFRPSDVWLPALPRLALIGAVLGLAAALLTWNWIAARRGYRIPLFLLAGAVSFPLFGAIASWSPTPGGAIGDSPGAAWIIVLTLIGALAGIAFTVWARSHGRR